MRTWRGLWAILQVPTPEVHLAQGIYAFEGAGNGAGTGAGQAMQASAGKQSVSKQTTKQQRQQ